MIELKGLKGIEVGGVDRIYRVGRVDGLIDTMQGGD